MSDTIYTPGPWHIEHGHLICGGEFGQIANIRAAGLVLQPEANANAQLIVTAPDMLAALQNLMNGVSTGAITSDHDETFSHACAQAKAAIAKATGGA